jgi:Spy/CpxP family protein refolding chaperone
MKKYLAVLTVLGFIFLSAAALAQQPPAKPEKPANPAPPGQGQAGPLAGLKNFLNLTPEQVQKIQDFRKARQGEQKAFREQMKKLRGEFQPLLKDSKADQAKINGLIDQMAKLGADRTKQVLAGRNGLQKFLTPEQLEKLKQAPGRLRQGFRMPGRGMGQGMGPGMRGEMGPMGRGGMMRPGMGRGMGRGMAPGMGRGMGQGMGPGQGRGFLGRSGFGRALMRFGRMLRMRRLGMHFGIWW